MWFKVDDGLHDHRKVRRCDDLAAMGLWVLAGSWAGANNETEGFVPVSVAVRWKGYKRLAGKLVDAGLWEVAELDGEQGWRFHDWHDLQPTLDQSKLPTERLRWRRGKALLRDRDLCERVVTRDRGMCRYCGVVVNWKDRKGATGGTYDHVDPHGWNEFDNVVVACRRCNGVKRDRTPLEADMVLLVAPSPDLAPARSGSDPDLALRTRGGTGQVGAGSGLGSGWVPAGSEAGPFDDPILRGVQ